MVGSAVGDVAELAEDDADGAVERRAVRPSFEPEVLADRDCRCSAVSGALQAVEPSEQRKAHLPAATAAASAIAIQSRRLS